MRLFQRITNYFRRSTPAPSAENKEQEKPISETLKNDLLLAEQIYSNSPPWLNEECPPMEGSGVGAVVAMEIARLITLESKIEVNDPVLDDVLQRYVVRNIRTEIEKGWALGGLVLKPYFVGANISLNAAEEVQSIDGNMKVEFYYPGQFIIRAYEMSGAVNDVSFYTVHKQGLDYFVLEERQVYDEATETTTITNQAYRVSQAPQRFAWDKLNGDKVPLETVNKWADLLPQYVFTGVNGVLCGFYRPPAANNTDLSSPYGKSPLVRAKNAIRNIDHCLNQLNWEMDATLARLFVDQVAYDAGVQSGGINKRIKKLFVSILGSPEKKLLEQFAPAIRQESYLAVYDAHLKQLEDAVGLAHGTISQPPAMARTATEVRMAKQRTFATIVDNQTALEECLRQLVYAMAVWAMPGKDISNIEPNFHWDDSVLSDPLEQMGMYLQLQQAGNIPKSYTNQVVLGKTEEQAQELVAAARLGIFADIAASPEGQLARDYPGIDPIYQNKEV